jgi:hypothetical protein
MSELTPFNQIPLIKYFQHDLETIKMAYRLADTIRADLKNIRSAGNQVEIAVKEFFERKLFPKYHVAQGHIIDQTLKVSPQFDIIICENSKNPVLFTLSDNSQLIYYETVFCFAEVKKSVYDKNLLADFCVQIQRTKAELKRAAVDPRFVETAGSGFFLQEPLTLLPIQNPLLAFLFFVNSSRLNKSDLKAVLTSGDNSRVPNFIVLLDFGLVVNVNKKAYEAGQIKINLYPEYETDETIWVMLELENENNTLMFQYLLVTEHLNSTITATPDVRKYTSTYFNITLSQTHPL